AVHLRLLPHTARARRRRGRTRRDVPLPPDVAARPTAADARAERAGRPPAAARRRRHTRRGGEALKLAVAGAVVFVVACVLVPEGLRSTALYADVHVYSDYAHRMLNGRVPYRDFFDEYPPLAQPMLLA